MHHAATSSTVNLSTKAGREHATPISQYRGLAVIKLRIEQLVWDGDTAAPPLCAYEETIKVFPVAASISPFFLAVQELYVVSSPLMAGQYAIGNSHVF